MGFSRKALLLACSASLLVSIPVFAELNNSDLVNAIKKAQFLDPSTQVNVRISGEEVAVSTFRNPHNNEKDLKIDAILIAKAVFDAGSSEFARVTVYFYGADLSQYQEISVTAGDVKAFAAGEIGKDQLLAGIKIESKRQESNSDKVAKQLHSAYFSKPDFKVAIQQGSVVEINTPIPAWVSDEECKIDALTMAVNSLAALPDGTRTIKVAMADPAGKADTRTFSFEAGRVKDLWSSVQSALGMLVATRTAPIVDLDSLKVVQGPALAERQKLLERLRALGKQGVGIAPFVQAFVSVEQTAKVGDEAATVAAVSRLSANLDAQEKAAAAAKIKPVASKSAPIGPAPTGGRTSRWALGDQPIIENDVLQNARGVVDKFAGQFAAGFKSAEENPRFLIVLDKVSQILRQNNRVSEAAAYEQRAAAIRARGVR